MLAMEERAFFRVASSGVAVSPGRGGERSYNNCQFYTVSPEDTHQTLSDPEKRLSCDL